MSILQFFPPRLDGTEHTIADDRLQRNPRDDIKTGLDMIFGLKDKLEKLHPLATETVLRIMTY